MPGHSCRRNPVSRRRPADGIRGPPGSERADPSCSAVSAMVPAVSGRSTCFRRTSSGTPDRRRHADPPVNPGSGLNGGRLRRHRSVTPSCRSGSGALAAIVRRRVFRMAPRSAPRELTRRPGRTFLEPHVPGTVRSWGRTSLAVSPGRTSRTSLLCVEGPDAPGAGSSRCEQMVTRCRWSGHLGSRFPRRTARGAEGQLRQRGQMSHFSLGALGEG